MSEDQPPNGTDAEGRERPSWYIPLQPVPETHHRNLTEVLLDTLGHEPLDLSPERAAETEAYLDQFLVPRESSES